MTFAAVSNVSDATLGKYLKIVSMNGVYGQLADQSKAWERILKRKKGKEEGREKRFLLRSAYGASAAGFLAVNGVNVSYPDAHQATIVEGTALFKDFGLTIEVERALIARAMSDMARYGEPLAEEIKCKTIAMSRILSAAVYQDGTGRIGTVSGTPAIVDGRIVVTLSTTSVGHVGWFEWGDKVKCVSTAGAAQSTTGGTHDHFTVEDINRSANTVTLASRTSASVENTITAVNEVGNGDYLLRNGITANDYTAISTNDYNTICESFVGLESLVEDDGRKVHGITLSRPVAGTRKTVTGLLDSFHFQQLLSSLKVAVGDGVYKWDAALMAPEVLDVLVESRETDRRFNSITDNKRGVASLGYVHGRDTIMFETDEYCPKNRTYLIPQGDVLQFYGSDFDWVKSDGGNGKEFFLKPKAGGHYRTVRAYMEGSGLILCVHPQAIGVLDGYSIT
jgi:hypothetical protein